MTNDNSRADNVTEFNGAAEPIYEKIIMDPSELLANSIALDWQTVMVIGKTAQGTFVFEASSEDYPVLNMLLDRVKRDLLVLEDTKEMEETLDEQDLDIEGYDE